MSKFFTGIYTALITPFKDNKIDFESFSKILQKQIDANVDGIVIGGSTGEISSLSTDEYNEILTLSRKAIPSNIKFIAGISSNITEKSIELIKIAESNNPDGLMCITPYYNRPPQRALVKYFTEINNATNLPIMLYTVPARTGVDFTDATIIELSKLDNIVALKDAGTDIERPLRLHNIVKNNFSFLSGEDSSCLAYSAHGGVGCVSVISNIFPKECKLIQDFLAKNDFASALKLQNRMQIIYDSVFVDTNPIPVKYAASIMNLCNPDVRLPLVGMDNLTLMQNIKNAIKSIFEQNL
jgi:4-hydroxy-tetrahydrodipicolinate synthase